MAPNPAEAYYAAVVESAEDAFIGKDLNGIIEACNGAAERLFGYSADELVGRPVTMLIPPNLQGEEANILARIRRGERVEPFETTRLAKGGRPISVSLTISPVRNGRGEVIGASKIARDISDRKRAAETQAYLAAIVESSDDAIISKDLNGIIRSCNAAAERMFGYTSSELIGQSVMILIPPERRHEEVEIISRLRRGERVDHFETVRVTRQGTPIDISLTISPVFGPSGEIIGASKTARDITEKKRLERMVAAQEEWFRVTLGSIGDGVITSDLDGRVTFMNPVAEKLTGWPIEQARSRPIGEVFHIVNEETRVPATNPTSMVIAKGKRMELANHTVLISRDGTEWPIEDSAAPIRDDAEKVVGVVLVFHEVSGRRRMETERLAAAAERDRLLESERAARAEAERASRVKDEFVAMVSHELRTPLNAILGWTELLSRMHPDPVTLQHGLDVVARNTRLQAQLISDLLDISRIVSGKLRLEVENVNLQTIIDESIETVQRSAEARGVAINRRVIDPVETVGDPARLQQVFWNILANAIKFTPAGGRVDVELRALDSHAEINISDTGIGIRPDLQSGVFDRFRQIGSTATRRYGGLGLGLSIARHLVDLHAGAIRVWSEGEGKGTTFTIELPITARIPRSAPGTPREVGAAGRGEHVLLENIKVLVVEDEEDTRDLIQRILENHEALVFPAGSAPEALAMLEAVDPDILLSDLGLPDVSGYELIQTIRRRKDRLGNIPAIALTAFARTDDRTRALRAGFQTHLAKPIEPAELIVTIASFGNLLTSRSKSPLP
jgi:PAS domain S-box-containing protein